LSNSDEVRWQQQLESLGLALVPLQEACEQRPLSDLERVGLIKNFEICFELSWKVLKDLLHFEGYDEKSPRSAFRTSFDVEYISESDCEVLLDALDKRNLLSQTYNKDAALQAEDLVRCTYFPVLLKVYQALDAKRET
jgi:nucleotidyltransferase substrate binding protein (TIGR01987 family)